MRRVFKLWETLVKALRKLFVFSTLVTDKYMRFFDFYLYLLSSQGPHFYLINYSNSIYVPYYCFIVAVPTLPPEFQQLLTTPQGPLNCPYYTFICSMNTHFGVCFHSNYLYEHNNQEFFLFL